MLIRMPFVTLLIGTAVLVRPFTVVPLPPALMPVITTWFGMAPFVIVLVFHFFGAGRNPAEWLLFVASVTAGSILLSWLTHVAVEKPFISLGHRIRTRSRRAVALDPSLRGQGAE